MRVNFGYVNRLFPVLGAIALSLGISSSTVAQTTTQPGTESDNQLAPMGSGERKQLPPAYGPPPPTSPEATEPFPSAPQQQRPPFNPPPYYPPPSVYPAEPSYLDSHNYRRGFRRVFLDIGVGPGLFQWKDNDDTDFEHELVSFDLRLGLGLTPHWSVVLGARSHSISETESRSYFSQSAYTLGCQYKLRRLYGRLEYGTITIQEDNFAETTGQVFAAGIGYEFVQTRNIALALEFNTLAANYSTFDTFSNVFSLVVRFY